jgi:hypothetical protein
MGTAESALGAKKVYLPVQGMLGAPARGRRCWGGRDHGGRVPTLSPAILRPVRGPVACRDRVQGVPAARAGRARPGGPLAQAACRPEDVAAVPKVPDVCGEIGGV